MTHYFESVSAVSVAGLLIHSYSTYIVLNMRAELYKSCRPGCNLAPSENPATNCRMSSDSYLNMQSLYNGRDVCSSVPKSNDPLSVVSDSVQLCGHNYVLAIVSNKHFNCLSSLDYTDRIQLYYHVYRCESSALIFYVVHGTSSQNRTLQIPTK